MTTTDALPSLAKQRREQEAQKKRKQQRDKLHKHQADLQRRQFNQSTSATADEYMQTALAKVRQSDVSIPHELARMHGSTIYQKPDKGGV